MSLLKKPGRVFESGGEPELSATADLMMATAEICITARELDSLVDLDAMRDALDQATEAILQRAGYDFRFNAKMASDRVTRMKKLVSAAGEFLRVWRETQL